MKLLRYGAEGAERPGLLDASGKIRDLSGHVTDIAADALTPDSLQRLAALDPETLPLVDGVPQQDLRLGKVGLHRAMLTSCDACCYPL